jgi:enterochelin esterase family protein
VAVLVSSCDRVARSIDLTCDDAFVDALADDLLPGLVRDLLATRGLTITADPMLSAVVGQSYGGLAAVYAAARRPDRFGLALSQSGSFWWPDRSDPSTRRIAGWLRSAPPRATRTVLQVGAYERVLTEANHEVAELIEARGEWLRLTEVPGGHDWAWWRSRLADGLEALFEPDLTL